MTSARRLEPVAARSPTCDLDAADTAAVDAPRARAVRRRAHPGGRAGVGRARPARVGRAAARAAPRGARVPPPLRAAADRCSSAGCRSATRTCRRRPRPPTPCSATPTVAAAVLMMVACGLGDPVAYLAEKSGALVQDVVPVPGQGELLGQRRLGAADVPQRERLSPARARLPAAAVPARRPRPHRGPAHRLPARGAAAAVRRGPRGALRAGVHHRSAAVVRRRRRSARAAAGAARRRPRTPTCGWPRSRRPR